MSKYITELSISQFRGINELMIENIGDINLFVGNNNVGKTSVLEAVKILSQPADIGNLVKTAVSRYSGGKNFLDTFLTIFQRKSPDSDDYNTQDIYEINISCKTISKSINVQIMGSVLEKLKFGGNEDEFENLKKVFEASAIIDIDGKKEHHSFTIDSAEVDVDITAKAFNALFMPVNISTYRSCVNMYTKVLQLQDKDSFIQIMQIFDNNIYDINIVDDLIWIQNRKKGAMPLFSYGSGMQKALLLGMVITLAKDGVVLIDEIETAMHAGVLKDVFSFFIKACKKMNVQAFVTTHSIEAVDNALYGANEFLNDMRIITFRQNDKKNKTYARVLTGEQALADRENYEMELRI